MADPTPPSAADAGAAEAYRDALNRIHELGAKLPVSEATILDLHRLSRGGLGDAGRYKQNEGGRLFGAGSRCDVWGKEGNTLKRG